MKSYNTNWNNYPRPQLKRANFKILNGFWKLNAQKIIVPFPPQSKLSEYSDNITDNLVYEYDFDMPESFTLKRTLIHFGAVDQIAEVWLNDNLIGRHEGGYLPFSFDITEFINPHNNKLIIKVTDSLSTDYPYGKQSQKRGGMWYTPISGIWQTVWLENVPEQYIHNIIITPDKNGVTVKCIGINNFKAIVELENDTLTLASPTDTLYINFSDAVSDNGKNITPCLWTMNNPYLYNMTIISDEDKIETYFALRTIEILDIKGVQRVCLNGEPIFLHGVLDQGYYEDGIYLPKEAAEYERDIIRMKELGFNTLRKHIKIEPEVFYYYCDKHGMLVMQDMVNNGHYSFLKDTALPTIGLRKRNDRKKNTRDEFRREIFKKHMIDTIQQLYNHPCIICYSIFNEGWGQFESDKMYELAKSTDSTRLYDTTSGWFAHIKSDFDSEHIYFITRKLHPKKRPMLLSECGGYTYKIEGHCFNPDKSYGYGTCKNASELTDRIISMYHKMVLPAIPDGLCGCIYTQLSDVEDEINGFYTYDRALCKVDSKKLLDLSEEIRTILC